ncbi:MAG TPA: hypothetical protein VI669_17830 [Vicinamibacteria bacterium]
MLPVGFVVARKRERPGGDSASRLQGAVLYREVQKYGWPWPGMLIVLAGALTIGSVVVPFSLGMWQQLVLGKPWGDRPMPDAAFALIGPFAILLSFLPIAVLLMPLRVEVRADGISIQLVGFLRRRVVPRKEIHGAALTHIGPVGWGYRHGRGRAVYRMDGSEGVELELTSGKKIVIGSQRPRSLLDAVQSMLRPEPGR